MFSGITTTVLLTKMEFEGDLNSSALNKMGIRI